MKGLPNQPISFSLTHTRGEQRNTQDGGPWGTLKRLPNCSHASRKQPIGDNSRSVTVIKHTYSRSTYALPPPPKPHHQHNHRCPPHLCLCTADKGFKAAQQCRHQNGKSTFQPSLSLAVVPAAFHLSLLIPWASLSPSAQSPAKPRSTSTPV